MAVHRGDIDDEPHRIAQAAAGRLHDRLHVQKGPAHARRFAVDKAVGGGIDAPHSGNEHQIAGADAEAPWAGRLDRAGRRQNLDFIGRHWMDLMRSNDA
jgi:hypothetical protein